MNDQVLRACLFQVTNIPDFDLCDASSDKY